VHYEYAAKKGGKGEHQHKIISLTEGKYTKGRLAGFARKIEANGDCKIGYWTKLELKFPENYKTEGLSYSNIEERTEMLTR